MPFTVDFKNMSLHNNISCEHVARPNREKGGSEAGGTRFECATRACACEFKTLRLRRVLSTQLVGKYKEPKEMWAVTLAMCAVTEKLCFFDASSEIRT